MGNFGLEILKGLKSKIGEAANTQSGKAARVEFVATVYLYGLVDSLRNYDYFETHNLGERDLDTCFEMGDGAEVIHGVIAKAKAEPALMSCLIDTIGSEQLKVWIQKFEQVENQGNFSFDF